jgi:3-oxoacyl-[acyl-carrier-protein] synthase-3
VTGRALDQIRTIAFHQANSFVIGKLAYKLRLRTDQVPQNCETLGNTVSASIPILLQSAMTDLHLGDLVMAVGFGVGLSWGVAVFEHTVAS